MHMFPRKPSLYSLWLQGIQNVKILSEDADQIRKNYSKEDDENDEVEQINESEIKINEDEKIEEVMSTERPKREIKLPKRYNDHVVYVNLSNVSEPENYEEAINCLESRKWKDAMNEELRSLEENETWSLVDLPRNKNIIDVKWIYKLKTDGKYKARVVAKGFQQQYQENEEIYSPVARMTTLKILLSVACNRSWIIEQMDVQTADS